MRHACKVQKREDDLRRCHEELVEERRGKRFREHARAGAASACIEHKRGAEGDAERRTASRQIRGNGTVGRYKRGEVQRCRQVHDPRVCVSGGGGKRERAVEN